ncbi:MAG: hypothetical protein R3F28_12250 [Candidatus Kapaibacterium sp.]
MAQAERGKRSRRSRTEAGERKVTIDDRSQALTATGGTFAPSREVTRRCAGRGGLPAIDPGGRKKRREHPIIPHSAQAAGNTSSVPCCLHADNAHVCHLTIDLTA